MSALGHKRTNRAGPKSTVVRYCPKADSSVLGYVNPTGLGKINETPAGLEPDFVPYRP
jgi:hypothetical protein